LTAAVAVPRSARVRPSAMHLTEHARHEVLDFDALSTDGFEQRPHVRGQLVTKVLVIQLADE
jgi:hypothetical protein